MIRFMKNELETEIRQSKRYLRRKLLIDRIEGVRPGIDGEHDSSEASKLDLSLIKRPQFKDLKHEYWRLVPQLNHRLRDCTVKTYSEVKIRDLIKHSTGLKFHQSIWIVNRNVDFFFPSVGQLNPPIIKGSKLLREKKMRGFAIEVNGSVHNHELKMQKDASKYRLLEDLGIYCTDIENQDIFENGVRILLEQLRKLERLDSRARKRVWKKIYTYTLAYHASDEVMAALYGDAFVALASCGAVETLVKLGGIL